MIYTAYRTEMTLPGIKRSTESVDGWQNIGASVVRSSWANIYLVIEHWYTLRQPDEVLAFLEENPFLVSLLIEAYSPIQHYFPDSNLFLEMFADPESTDDHQLLVALIATHLSPEEALIKLDQLDEDWWLDVMDRAQGKLCINVEFP
jgi:hypothetical protein